MISIVTCNYNLGHLLKKTLLSVLNQNIEDFEIIVVDAASEDNSEQILINFQKKHEKLRYISEPDNGHFDGINKGIKLCKGDIIGILHCSDFYENNIFAKIKSEFENDKDLWILGGGNKIVLNNLAEINNPVKSKYMSVNDCINYEFPAIESTFFRREVFTEISNFSNNEFLKRCHTNIFLNLFLGSIVKKKKIKLINYNFSYHQSHESIREDTTRNTLDNRAYSEGRKVASKLYSEKFKNYLSNSQYENLSIQGEIYDLTYLLFRRKFKIFFDEEKQISKKVNFFNFIKANVKVVIGSFNMYFQYFLEKYNRKN